MKRGSASPPGAGPSAVCGPLGRQREVCTAQTVWGGNGLADALTFGRLAGTAAAQNLP